MGWLLRQRRYNELSVWLRVGETRCFLAVITGLKARHRAIENGRARAVLYAELAVFETAHGGYGSRGGERGCLGASWR